MKLLQNSWSEMLIMDQIHQRLHNHLPDETTLHNGQKFELLSLALLGVPSMAETFQEITNKFTALKFDSADYVCLKFALLLSPGKYSKMLQLSLLIYSIYSIENTFVFQLIASFNYQIKLTYLYEVDKTQ